MNPSSAHQQHDKPDAELNHRQAGHEPLIVFFKRIGVRFLPVRLFLRKNHQLHFSKKIGGITNITGSAPSLKSLLTTKRGGYVDGSAFKTDAIVAARQKYGFDQAKDWNSLSKQARSGLQGYLWNI